MRKSDTYRNRGNSNSHCYSDSHCGRYSNSDADRHSHNISKRLPGGASA